MTELTSLRAVGSKVWIRPDPEQGKTESGIILASAWQHPPCAGTAVAVGPRAELDIKVGDRVAYRWIDAEQAGATIEWQDEKFKVLNVEQLVGVVE